MEKLFAKVFGFVINFVYSFFKLRKAQNKVTFISRQSNTPSLDFCRLIEELKENHPDCKVDVLCKMIPRSFSGKISYGFEMLRQMKSLATSKAVVIDGYCILVCMLKHKKSLTVIQTWHALGAIKQFGWQSIGAKEGRNERLSVAMHMHRNYDYVLAPSKRTAEFYSEAFDIPMDKIKIFTLPRVDYILDGKDRRDEFYSLNPNMAGKKIFLYLPTFRTKEAMAAKLLTAQFENAKDNQLVISTHPLSVVEKDERFTVNGNFSSYDLMKIADIIITDYSACAFEASVLLKPLYFFVPDYDFYMKNRGINVDLKKEFPSAAFEKADELCKSIDNSTYDMDALVQFKDTYVEHEGTNNTKNLADFIVEQIGQ
ncbi:MAG: CDP-glycerol glycerophosphotransferase family protein [Eubacterium sp.]|nr:CDP-glycerol glycerophosphotransferase family protein [Eubacterium sp.]